MTMVLWIDEDDALMLVSRHIGTANFDQMEPVLKAALAGGVTKRADGMINQAELRTFLGDSRRGKGSGGRPSGERRVEALEMLPGYIHENGYPETLAELERVVRNYFLDKGGDAPAESSIREWVKPVWNARPQ